jgi:hypothetical protein
MSRPAQAPTGPDADQSEQIAPEIEAELRRRLETYEEDAKAARPWQTCLPI